MSRYGITIGTNSIHSPNLYTGWASLIPAMQSRGIDLIRFQRKWSDIETSQGVYDWSVTDDIYAHLQANNIKWHFTLQGAPSWALLNPAMQSSTLPWFLPDPTLMAGFAKAICLRYPNIYAIGYNEDFNIHHEVPNAGIFGLFGSPYAEYNAIAGIPSNNVEPDRDPHFAALCVQAVNPIFRQYLPNAKVGLPCIWWRRYPNVQDFLSGLYDLIGSSLNQLYDFADLHFYSNTADPMTAGVVSANYTPSFLQAIASMQLAMQNNGATQKEIWVSEFGWQVPTDCTASVQATRYQEILSAAAITAGLTAQTGPRVTRMIAYTYDYVGNDQSSLVQSDHVTYQPADAVFSNFIAQNPDLIGKWGRFMAHA